MIKAEIYQSSDKDCLGFKIEGHAGYAEAGEDIVCAAVSMLVINTINSIEVFTEEEFTFESDEESGRIEMMFKEHPGERAALLCDSLVLGLQGVESEYGNNYLKVYFREV